MGLPMELVSTTNPSFEYLVGQQGGLVLNRNAEWILDTGTIFRTSYLVEVTYVQVEPQVLEMSIRTKNSMYIFRSFEP